VCVCVFLRVHIYTYRPNIILTPDVRWTVKTPKTEARTFVFAHFRLPITDPSFARIPTKIDCNSEFGISLEPETLEADELGENRE